MLPIFGGTFLKLFGKPTIQLMPWTTGGERSSVLFRGFLFSFVLSGRMAYMVEL